MKRGKDEEKMMGPMFPRLHVNDTEKGGPRAPPRNKMALYEQLSIPSQRFSLPCNPNDMSGNHSSQGGGSESGLFFSRQVPPRHPSEKQYSQYSDLTTPLSQVEQHKRKLDEDDYRVPIFIHSTPSKNSDTYSNNMDSEKLLPSNPPYFHHSLNFQTEGKNKNGENSENRVRPEVEKRYSSNSRKALPSDQNIVHDLSDDAGSREDGSCRPLQMGNLDCVSETSILDVVSELDMTPDDVVGVIGQKHFWKARRAIVQKLIAESPHLLLEDSAYFDKPIKPLPVKKLPLDYAIKAIPNVSKQKSDLEKPTRKKEGSAENTVEKTSLSSSQNGPSNDHNAIKSPCFNQPQGHQWLIPVMSPSEGLVYKPYPGPGFVGQSCGGCGPPGPNPHYGFHAPPPQYHFPSFPPFGPHGYFNPYGMPIMNTTAFSGSSMEQTNPNLGIQGDNSSQKNGARLDSCVYVDIEVQASTASSPSEKRSSGRASRATKGKNMLPLFPTSPAIGASELGSEPEGPTRVIKVVPRNGLSASESAARIFRSIQEERKQYDSV
ncbi:hypothetical protein DH2020_025485 [Rehmannia glutinosa]|uniref:Protein EARLY FLOWERING 3 n=1 Tax=Rehmannia glutinosa TaxID=99300 RepID=A0ABR0VZK8_REHGL